MTKFSPTFFLREGWWLHLRKSRLFFSEIFSLVVLMQGHVHVRILALKNVSRVTTGIRLIHRPGLFHIYVIIVQDLSITTAVTLTIFDISAIIRRLHVAVAVGSWVSFINFLHAIVHFVILSQPILYICVHTFTWIYTRCAYAWNKKVGNRCTALRKGTVKLYA